MRRFVFCAAAYWSICLLLLGTTLIDPASTGAHSPKGNDEPDQVVLIPDTGPHLAAGDEYRSPPTRAARPFTHLLIRHEATVPVSTTLTLFVRASLDGAGWSDWVEVLENHDLWRPEDGPDVMWSQTIDVGAAARFWQVRGVFAAAPDGAQPILRRIDVNTVDANAFAPLHPAAGGAEASTQAAAAIPRPGVVSRSGWGCPDGQGSRVPPAYYPVNHITVHHTADSNSLYPSEKNWAARVRAEWSFHTYTRGWGDIGYNYIIDPNGVIYEGRAGGDDAIAFHDTANYGSMGVVVLGTYTSVTPTQKSQDSLVKLLAWKAAQKQIDPLGSSYYYGCANSRYCNPYNPGAITPNISGHRQITPGHTTCPGDALVTLLPTIRNRVKQAISSGDSGNPASTDLQIDELEGGFARSSANWYDAACGAGGHTYYTYATDNPSESTNRATWRPTIPASGTYRVYAYIPQGCGLATPPYAATSARYTITFAGGKTEKIVDQNTPTAWVDLGVYQFSKGTGGTVELSDLTGEPFSARRVLFFDAVKWVPESASTNAALVSVRFDRTTVASGELLKVMFTVKNTGGTTLLSQDPQAGTTPAGQFNDGLGNRPDDAYVYDEGECFIGNQARSYPAFPKEGNRFRVTLGPTDASGIACAGETGGYPWRWGLNGDLPPGATRDIVGYVRFRNDTGSNRTLTLRAGLIQEYVRYFAQDVQPTTITITPERIRPDAAGYDTLLNPVARVYRLGALPDNFLARTANSLSIQRGDYAGSIPWNGGTTDWGSDGPLGLKDHFLIEQARSFVAPISGTYTFRTISDDGSWLWVDGRQVIVNNGLHEAQEVSGTIELEAGVHVLSFRYFERTGLATAGYSIQLPGSSAFVVPPEPNGSLLRLGTTFVDPPDLVIAADDQGGSGVDHIRWSWDGQTWADSPGALLRLGRLGNGSYRLRYQIVDRAGNQSEQYEFAFNVNTNLTVYRNSLPLVGR